MAFDATIGGTASNSYITVEAAEAYMLGRLGVEAWDDAEADDREAALIMATERIDLEDFVGEVATTSQRLQWPRVGTYNRKGVMVTSTSIPSGVLNAVCELALVFLTDPDSYGGDDPSLAAFQNLRLGSLDMTPRRGAYSTRLPPQVRKWLAHWLRGGFMTLVSRA